jgi:predicted  nucleic acid-binding Zn-ribbon protein
VWRRGDHERVGDAENTFVAYPENFIPNSCIERMDGVRRTVSADGITVEKRAATDQFNTPAVIVEITSTADRNMMVMVTEPIPESVSMEDIGFHPDYGGEHWSIADQEIVFTRTIDAGDEYTTVYGVRGIGGEDITTFVDAETSVSTGEGIATGADIGDADADPVSTLLTEDDDEIVRRMIAGDDDSLSAPESTDQEESKQDQEDSEPDEEKPEQDQQESKQDQEDPENTGGSEEGDLAESRRLPDSVAEALVREIRDGTISEEHERVLREAFSGSKGTQRDVDIRIKRLQTEVSDLAAYVDEFERLLEEYDGGDEPLASLEATLVTVTDRVEELENDVDAVNKRLADIEDELDTLRADLDGDRSEDVDALRERLENVEAELEDVLYLEEEVMELDDQTDAIQRLEETVETLETEMAELNAFRDRLSSAFGPDGDRFEEQGE